MREMEADLGHSSTEVSSTALSWPLLTFLGGGFDHQCLLNHPLSSDPDVSSHRWHAIHAAWSAHWCPWHDIGHPHAAPMMPVMSELFIDQVSHGVHILSPSLPSPCQYHGEGQGIWGDGHSFCPSLGRNQIRRKCIPSKVHTLFCACTQGGHS